MASKFSNIWKHPKTTIVGALTGTVAIGTALSVVPGVSKYAVIASGVASLLLGAFAKDPGAAATPATPPVPPVASSTQKIGAIMLIVLLIQLPLIQGCNANKVAQQIVNWTPALQSAAQSVGTSYALLDPADAQLIQTYTAGFVAASNLVDAQARAYLATPTATILAQLQNQVIVFQQQVNTSLLQAAKIKDPASQAHAMAAIQAVATIVNTILALVVSISSKSQVAAMQSKVTVTLYDVEKLSAGQFGDRGKEAEILAAHYNEGFDAAARQVDWGRAELAQAGF